MIKRIVINTIIFTIYSLMLLAVFKGISVYFLFLAPNVFILVLFFVSLFLIFSDIKVFNYKIYRVSEDLHKYLFNKIIINTLCVILSIIIVDNILIFLNDGTLFLLSPFWYTYIMFYFLRFNQFLLISLITLYLIIKIKSEFMSILISSLIFFFFFKLAISTPFKFNIVYFISDISNFSNNYTNLKFVLFLLTCYSLILITYKIISNCLNRRDY